MKLIWMPGGEFDGSVEEPVAGSWGEWDAVFEEGKMVWAKLPADVPGSLHLLRSGTAEPGGASECPVREPIRAPSPLSAR